mgnify:CR=1 FL=1
MSTRRSTTIATATISVLLLTAGAEANHHCPDVASMRLTATENHLSLNDNIPVCVTRNENGEIDATFRITIKNPVEVGNGDVTVIQKESAEPLSITGGNEDETNKVKITVTGTPPEGFDEFAYKIYVKDIGMLDPKVRVVDNDTLTAHKADVLENTLDDNDISVDEAAEVLRTIKP